MCSEKCWYKITPIAHCFEPIFRDSNRSRKLGLTYEGVLYGRSHGLVCNNAKSSIFWIN